MKLQEIASQVPLIIELVRGLLAKGVKVYWGHNKVIGEMHVGKHRTMLSFIRPNGRVVDFNSRFYSIEHLNADKAWDLSNLDGDWKLHTTREGVGGNLDESVDDIETPLLMVLANNLIDKGNLIQLDTTVNNTYTHRGSVVYIEIGNIPVVGLEANKKLIGTKLDKCVKIDYWKQGATNKSTTLMAAIEDFDDKYELVNVLDDFWSLKGPEYVPE